MMEFKINSLRIIDVIHSLADNSLTVESPLFLGLRLINYVPVAGCSLVW